MTRTGLDALFMLAAQPEFWAVHVLSVSVAAAEVGVDGLRIAEELADRSLADLVVGPSIVGLVTVFSVKDLGIPNTGDDAGARLRALEAAGREIDLAIPQEELSRARMCTAKILHCPEECNGSNDDDCFIDCLTR